MLFTRSPQSCQRTNHSVCTESEALENHEACGSALVELSIDVTSSRAWQCRESSKASSFVGIINDHLQSRLGDLNGNSAVTNIDVNSASIARKKCAIGSGRSRHTFTKKRTMEHGYSSVHAKKRWPTPHNLALCTTLNLALGKTHSAK